MALTEEKLSKVWDKATKVQDVNPAEWRQDYAGAWINFNQRGEEGGKFGWEVDHVKPLKEKGSDELGNLLPLHWRNNREKGDKYPEWETAVSSKTGEKKIENIELKRPWKHNV
jgi:hypothetical protein